ncbi:MAG: pyridoxal-phosphate dependent enzyme, partial [Candidatus Atribacteria bacterium]|nr:pyridoxal-phosphate dependent enzyme [Candidatus Atribacteria bacterium]
RDKINKTPCIYSLTLSRILKKEIFLKLENLQLTQAFKARGNANKMSLLTQDEKDRGVITASSGNHGQGLSLAALLAGVKATIFLPEVAPQNKIDKIKENKAEVIIKGKTYDDASHYAHLLAKEKNYVYIPSFNDLDIIAGNGSIGLEILEDVPQAQMIICPIGGGGGISGVSLAAKQLKPDIKMVGVEAEKAPSMLRSIEADKLVELDSADTFADGIAVRKSGKINFKIVKKYVDSIVTVSDEEMKSAVFTLAKEAKIVAEGAGAASVAALLSKKIDTKNISNIVCMISGGNIDIDMLRDILGDFNH